MRWRARALAASRLLGLSRACASPLTLNTLRFGVASVYTQHASLRSVSGFTLDTLRFECRFSSHSTRFTLRLLRLTPKHRVHPCRPVERRSVSLHQGFHHGQRRSRFERERRSCVLDLTPLRGHKSPPRINRRPRCTRPDVLSKGCDACPAARARSRTSRRNHSAAG